MKANSCNTSSNCKHKIFAWAALAVGVVSAVLTQSWEAFTLGWFFVAAVLLRGKKKDHTHAYDASCDIQVPAVKAKKAAVPRKNAKKIPT